MWDVVFLVGVCMILLGVVITGVVLLAMAGDDPKDGDSG